MNSTTILVLSTLLATSTAVAVTVLRSPEAPVAPTGIAELQREVADLRSANQKLQQRLEAIASTPASAAASLPSAGERASVASVSPEQVAAAVESYLQRRAGPGAVDAAAKPAAAFDLATEFSKLQGTNFFEDSALWKRLMAAGKMDEAIKQFEELAKAHPTDTKAQMDLANAYLAYLNMDQTKWQLSMKADAVFDKVLDLDEKHWEARFTKAVSYTFWPDFLGKKKEAISHFETLVAQQEAMPAQAHEAETYLYLGNLLEARDPAKAKEVWSKGARRHPDNQELAKKAK